jgi:hypothetical protein
MYPSLQDAELHPLGDLKAITGGSGQAIRWLSAGLFPFKTAFVPGLWLRPKGGANRPK